MTHPTLFQRALACHIGNISPDVKPRRVSAIASFVVGLLLVGLAVLWMVEAAP